MSQEMKVLVPKSPDQLGGPFVTVDESRMKILAEGDKVLIVRFIQVPERIDWFKDFEFMVAQRQNDPATMKIIRTATPEDLRLYRLPVWIQDEEQPECCGKPMRFVGQIDDNQICMERPPDAKMWWHDAASFYVFTCDQCLECKAVGQQF
jgi:hypothetical protein